MELEVLMIPRGEGKTTQALLWVEQGERVSGYPGWSRVLVIPTLQRFNWIRNSLDAGGMSWWARLDDFDHRVYTHEDWRKAHNVQRSTEVRVDDMEELLPYLPGHLTGFTMTGTAWEKVPFTMPEPKPEFLG